MTEHAAAAAPHTHTNITVLIPPRRERRLRVPERFRMYAEPAVCTHCRPGRGLLRRARRPISLSGERTVAH